VGLVNGIDEEERVDGLAGSVKSPSNPFPDEKPLSVLATHTRKDSDKRGQGFLLLLLGWCKFVL
jgi:hypothetical protein